MKDRWDIRMGFTQATARSGKQHVVSGQWRNWI